MYPGLFEKCFNFILCQQEEAITSMGKELLLYPCGQEDHEPDYSSLFKWTSQSHHIAPSLFSQRPHFKLELADAYLKLASSASILNPSQQSSRRISAVVGFSFQQDASAQQATKHPEISRTLEWIGWWSISCTGRYCHVFSLGFCRFPRGHLCSSCLLLLTARLCAAWEIDWYLQLNEIIASWRHQTTRRSELVLRVICIMWSLIL